MGDTHTVSHGFTRTFHKWRVSHARVILGFMRVKPSPHSAFLSSSKTCETDVIRGTHTRETRLLDCLSWSCHDLPQYVAHISAALATRMLLRDTGMYST